MVEASGLGWQGRYEQAELVARFLKAQASEPAKAAGFAAKLTGPAPDLSGGYRYLKLERMAYYVNKDVYRRTVSLKMIPVDEVRLNFNPASLQLLNGVLAFLMFGIALDTRVEDFKRVARMPIAMAVAIAAQFLLLPAITYVLTLVLQPAPSIALGMILVACCPPGNISNIITHRAGGNVALSVSMTAVSNALAIVLMPLNVAFWGGMHPTAAPLLRSIALDPLEMGLHIVIIIGLPFVLGMACAKLFAAFTDKVKKPARIL
eukprot:gene3556-4570_t